jgi:hypothetical protein
LTKSAHSWVARPHGRAPYYARIPGGYLTDRVFSFLGCLIAQRIPTKSIHHRIQSLFDTSRGCTPRLCRSPHPLGDGATVRTWPANHAISSKSLRGSKDCQKGSCPLRSKSRRFLNSRKTDGSDVRVGKSVPIPLQTGMTKRNKNETSGPN